MDVVNDKEIIFGIDTRGDVEVAIGIEKKTSECGLSYAQLELFCMNTVISKVKDNP